MKYIFTLFLFVFMTTSGWACESTGRSVSNIQLHVIIPTMSHKDKVGDVLYSRQASLAELTNSSDDLLCSDRPGLLNIAGTLSGRETGLRVYQSSIPGIGIRMFYYVRQPTAVNILKVLPFSLSRIIKKNEAVRPEDVTLKIELVKTGAVNSSKVLLFHQASLLQYSVGGHTAVVNLHIIGTLPEAVCNFDSPQTVIHLPAQQIETITEKKPKIKYPLPINISCSGEPHMMTVTLNGDIYDASRGIFNIEQVGNSAKGVGVQFWYHDRLVHTGSVLSLFSVNEPGEGNKRSIPFSISYIRTNKNALPGKVRIATVLHINYL